MHVQKRPRAGVLAKVACEQCRRLKLKCIQIPQSSCRRCYETGRDCIFAPATARQKLTVHPELLNRAPQVQHELDEKSPSRPSHPNPSPDAQLELDSSRALLDEIKHVANSRTDPGVLTYILPLDTRSLLDLNNDEVNTSTATSSPDMASLLTGEDLLSSKRSFDSLQLGGDHLSMTTAPVSRRTPTLEEDLPFLCRFFEENILPHTPFLEQQEVSNHEELFNRSKRPLACAMAFVAASFIPGYRNRRRGLVPEVVGILRSQFNLSRPGRDHTWINLQALAILYFWAPKYQLEPEIGSERLEYCLCQDALALCLESLTLNCQLPQTAANVAPLLANEQNLESVDKHQFCEFLFWLWTLTESYLQALLDRTSPRIWDAHLILKAALTLQTHREKELVRKLLPQIELCQLCEEVNNCCGQQPDEGSWASSPNIILRSIEDLSLVNQKFVRWRERWSLLPSKKLFDPRLSAGYTYNNVCGYYVHCRICVQAKLSLERSVQSTAPDASLLLHRLATEAFAQALALCHFLLDLTPLEKSALRCLPKKIHTMIFSACSYIICYAESTCWMADVKAVADLLIEIAVDQHSGAAIYGRKILGEISQMNCFATPSTGTGAGVGQSMSAGGDSHLYSMETPKTMESGLAGEPVTPGSLIAPDFSFFTPTTLAGSMHSIQNPFENNLHIGTAQSWVPDTIPLRSSAPSPFPATPLSTFPT